MLAFLYIYLFFKKRMLNKKNGSFEKNNDVYMTFTVLNSEDQPSGSISCSLDNTRVLSRPIASGGSVRSVSEQEEHSQEEQSVLSSSPHLEVKAKCTVQRILYILTPTLTASTGVKPMIRPVRYWTTQAKSGVCRT